MRTDAVALRRKTWLDARMATLRNYVSLTKPVVISLLLVTTVPAMVVADGGWPGTWLVVATLIGGTLSAGGANAINCWYDRDIDKVMKRTRQRPLVTGEVTPPHALTFGIALGAIAFVFLWTTTTLAAAALALAALLFYVFIYTMWLKRRSNQNIVIGGAAGAFPPLVGWAAVSGDVTWSGIVMFAIVFFWTPPHFWALALRLKNDYAEAGVPMLPVTDGPEATRKQIFLYSIALAAISIALVPVAGLHWTYGTTAVLGSGAFIYLAHKLWRHPDNTSPMDVYKYSLLYLAVLFLAMAGDVGTYGR